MDSTSFNSSNKFFIVLKWSKLALIGVCRNSKNKKKIKKKRCRAVVVGLRSSQKRIFQIRISDLRILPHANLPPNIPPLASRHVHHKLKRKLDSHFPHTCQL